MLEMRNAKTQRGKGAKGKAPLARVSGWLGVRLPHLGAYGFYLVIAGIITWPLLTVFSTHFIGHPFGDSYEYARLTWWFKYALQTGQSPFFQPWLAYPEGLTSWLLWSIPLQSFPAWLFAFILPLPAAMNLALLLRLALNGWAMYWLLWRLTGKHWPALLAGVIFLAYPTFQGQLAAGHTGLLALWPVPLYVYSLQSLVFSHQSEDRKTPSVRRQIGLTALFFVLSVLGSNQILIYLLFPITAVLGLALLIRRNWRALRRVIVAVTLGGGLALVFIVPGFVEALNAPPWLRERGDVTYSADLLSIITPSFQHPVFGSLDYTHTILGVDPFEKPGYIGIVAGLLALIGFWKRREARWWLVVALLGWVFALGPLLNSNGQPVTLVTDGYPTFVPLPWALYQQLPLFNIVRVPARFHFALAFAVSILAGYGAAAVSRQSPVASRQSKDNRFHLSQLFPVFATLLVSALVLWEYQLFWTGMPRISAAIPQAVTDMAQRDEVRAVLDVPWEHLLTAKDGLYLQTAHQKPLIAGQITRRTPVNPAKLTVLQTTLDPALLDAAGVDVIILHKEWDEGKLEPFLRERLGQPTYEDDRIALFNAPEAQTAPGFTAVLTPETEISDHADSHIYAPERGTVTLHLTLTGTGRAVGLYLDQQLVERWTVHGEMTTTVPVTLPAAGYHTVTLAVEPPCPVSSNLALGCKTVTLTGLTEIDWNPQP